MDGWMDGNGHAGQAALHQQRRHRLAVGAPVLRLLLRFCRSDPVRPRIPRPLAPALRHTDRSANSSDERR